MPNMKSMAIFRVKASWALGALFLVPLLACSAELDSTNDDAIAGESQDGVRNSRGAEEVAATADTLIKSSAKDSSTLASEDKCAIRKGAKVALIDPQVSGAHVFGKLASAHGCGGKFGSGATVYLYRAHFTGWSAEQPVSAPGAGPIGPWACSGVVGKTRPPDGRYWITTFGASSATSGTTCDDAEDNCIGACTGSAVKDRLCPASQVSTPAVCQRSIKWFVADQARFGCGSRVAVTNPSNGKSVVAYVLDEGPSCFVERRVSAPVLDASPAVNTYLTGSSQHGPGEVRVQAVLVPSTTPLGPR